MDSIIIDNCQWMYAENLQLRTFSILCYFGIYHCYHKVFFVHLVFATENAKFGHIKFEPIFHSHFFFFYNGFNDNKVCRPHITIYWIFLLTKSKLRYESHDHLALVFLALLFFSICHWMLILKFYIDIDILLDDDANIKI